ncbi:MAG: RNA methyltransferase [Longibaculum muris]|uniref:TrmH family RNA methyltransferase n=1 Tax=Longibaculum muris TaxID=1796628 RepID=A0A4R3ZAG6_9FIRM|nr:RNA methyltransferase [Longibaculum muris]KXU51556.1 RNA methyltransferase, TrmH family [Candidatus Stoquefichus sp. KLE1796]MBS5368361.1 RNA methyltransferase [Coprobacillus cateniformis]MCR1886831.1 RNA methyltransferase [Longibaculum muris]MED9813340.1 RNA methyltransferase [Longibaculum muris]TCW02861.1 TrmH family RNA methyltransferase [Longibaculum muris]
MITSLQNETIKEIMKLKQKKYRDEKDLFLVEGYHLVEEARKANCIQMLITTLEEKFVEKTLYVSDKVMEKLAFTKSPQPIMAICYKNKNQELLKAGKRYLLLDGLQDPGNVGTIMRTALAFGYDQIIMSKDCVDLYNDKVIRSTQGALFQMNTCIMDLKEAITFLKQQGVKVYGTCLQNAQSIDQHQRYSQMAFVMGNEGQGVHQEILDLCDERLYIPIQSIESLNVAIAAAITMYHFKEMN